MSTQWDVHTHDWRAEKSGRRALISNKRSQK